VVDVTVHASVKELLFRGTPGIPSEITIFPSIPSSAELFFCRKFPTLRTSCQEAAETMEDRDTLVLAPWTRVMDSHIRMGLKEPKHEIFGSGFFTLIKPIWIGDLGTSTKN
jgi:hypothetical protein